MTARAAPASLCAAAVLGLAAAPAAAAGASGAGTMVEICTAAGSQWMELPADPAPPNKRMDPMGCAHMLCPREQGPERKRGAGRAR